MHGGLAVVQKRRALRLGFKLAAIEIKGQMRLDLDLALRSQGADKGNAQLQAAEHMLAAHALIGKFDPAIAQNDVVQGQLCWACVARGRAVFGQLGANVINIKLAPLALSQTHHGLVNLNGVQNRCQAPQGLCAGVDINALDLQLCKLWVKLSFRALSFGWGCF